MQADGRSPAADAAVTSSEALSHGVRRCDRRLGEAVLDGGQWDTATGLGEGSSYGDGERRSGGAGERIREGMGTRQ